MARKKGLGRGLNALLGSATKDIAEADDSTETIEPENVNRLKMLPVDKIQRGKYQPRVNFDQEKLQELADSILEKGLIQPILVRPVEDGFELIAGERRWRAAQLAELHEIPVIVKEYADKDAAAVSLIENIQRENLNPLEEARAFQRLQDEFGMTHKSVAKSVGRSRAAVSNLLRLLDLSDDVKRMLESSELEMGHARALLGVTKSSQHELARKVISKDLSVRATEALVKTFKEGPKEKIRMDENETVDSDTQALELRLSDTLGSRVSIKHKKSGGGKIEIVYSSLDELEGILGHIN